MTVTGADTPTRLQASRVSAELMTTLGVPPIVGRVFSWADELTGAPAILVSQRNQGDVIVEVDPHKEIDFLL